MVDGDATGVGFHGEPASHKTTWDAVAVADKLQKEIFVDNGLDGVTVVVRDHGHQAEGIS